LIPEDTRQGCEPFREFRDNLEYVVTAARLILSSQIAFSRKKATKRHPKRSFLRYSQHPTDMKQEIDSPEEEAIFTFAQIILANLFLENQYL